MSRPRFLSDHDLNEHIVDGALRREPLLEIVRSRDVGLAEATDDELLAYAARNGLLVISHDVNTMPAAAEHRIAAGEPFAGVVMIPQRQPAGEIIDCLILIWSASDAEEWRNLVCYLPL